MEWAAIETLPVEARRVAEWRYDCLIRLGCTEAVAELHALGTLDIHEVERIMGAGCELELALEVIA